MNTVTSRIWRVSAVEMRTRAFKYSFVGILAVLMVALAATGAMAVPSGLVYHWAFDEGPDWHDSAFQSQSSATTAFDSVGAADAALMNMTSADWVSGRQFTALDFDGSNDYLQTVTNLATPLGGTASLSFWIKTTQAGGSVGWDAPGVVGVEASGTNDVQWGWMDSSGRIALSVLGTENVVRSTAAINDGKWHHVVFTRNASTGACQIYVDGVVGTPGTGPTGTVTTAFHSIGRIEDPNSGTPRYFLGRLDQIHVFNTVIDQTMVTQLQDNHAPKTWDVQTNGTNTAAFSTASALFSSYDPEQDTLSVSSYVQPSHGSVTYNGDGTFTYTATGGYTGADSFGVTVEDGKGGFCDAVMNILVQAPPTDPDAGKRTTTFTNFAALQAGGVTISLSGYRVPRMIDWNVDGKKDLLISNNGAVWRYNNTGTVSAPVFAAGVKVQAGGSDIALSGSTGIALADMTGDGVTDLIAVDSTRKIRVYRNTSAAGQTPVYAAATIVKDSGGADFVLPDQRFDVGFWDSDSLPDVIMGNWAGECRAYTNVGSASDPRFSLTTYEALDSGAYNLCPRVFDINRNGTPDYIRGENWGGMFYWFDPVLYEGLGTRSGSLTVTYSNGTTPAFQSLTDGQIMDFADYNGDGAYDILIGGHAGTAVYIATGVPKTVAQSIADIEAIYDSHPSDLGTALEANSQQHLNEVKAAENNIIQHMFSGLLTERQTMFSQMTTHVQKYSFLQMGSPLSLPLYHHVPSIAGQNLVTMQYMLPDTPTHRTAVADAVGLTGLWRTVFLNTGLHVGDNQHCSQGQLESIRDVMAYYPRTPLFPDTCITIDNYWGDGQGGRVNAFTSQKNTFSTDTGYNDLEQSFAADCVSVIEEFYGAQPEKGDYFTFVMGHEVSHSLDNYVRTRANTDLDRRWGQVLTYAAGPDVVTSNNDGYGWYDWTATKAHFLADGYWDGNEANWATDWAAYWATGPGSAWRDLAFMRGGIDWFLAAPQESLATQANQSWAGGEPRLIGAIDRYNRGVTQGIAPMKANINEVVHFLDVNSAGLNKIVMLDTTGVMTPYPHAQYDNVTAWLERDDTGYVTRITTSTGRIYDLTYESHGILTSFQINFTLPGPAVPGGDWKLDDNTGITATDSSGNGNNGTLTNGPTWVPGFKNSAVQFDGVDDYVALGHRPSISGTSDFTVSAWIKTSAATAGVIMQQRNGGFNGEYKFSTNANGTLQFMLYGNGYQFNFATAQTVNNGAWRFVVAVRSGLTGNIYIDGNPTPAGTQTGTAIAPLDAAISTAIGRDIRDNVQPFNGTIDEVKLLTTALTGAQVQALYNDYMGTNSPPAWNANPIVEPNATAGTAYTGTIADHASDPDAGDTITISKVSGPAWLTVAGNGALSGTPGTSDAGLNTWPVRATDNHGATADTSLQITVTSAPVVYYPSSYAVIQGTYVSGNVASLVSNDNNYLVIASQTSGTTRYATTDFTVTGITVPSPSKITVQVIAKSSKSNTTQRIKLWNYSTSVWDQKDSATISTSEVTRSFDVTTGASNYISGGQLKVETNDSHGNRTSFNASHEVVSVTITP